MTNIAAQRCNGIPFLRCTAKLGCVISRVTTPEARSVCTGVTRLIYRPMYVQASAKSATGSHCKSVHSSAALATASTEFAHMQELGPQNLEILRGASRASEEFLASPTRSQLRTLFVSSAVPMIGFGFMDNFIMIQAGGYIDSTLGVKFGLATITAAAMGQVVSDVSGVLFGGVFERTLVKFGLIRSSNLTIAQRQLPTSRRMSMAGAVLGVMFGCVLGASSLLFLDIEGCEHQKRAAELQQILTEMLEADGANDVLSCESCKLYLLHEHSTEFESEDPSAPRVVSIGCMAEDSHVKKCARTGTFLIDNHAEEVVQGNVNQASSTMCAPVTNNQGAVVAVVEFRNKKNDFEKKCIFTESDEQLAKMLAHHVGIFMDRIAK